MIEVSHNITTKELARRLDVSRATVSIVLNGRAQQRSITPETTRRVLDAARELGYVPNQTARNLRRQRSGVVGVVLANFRMDWAERVMTGMLEVFDRSGFTPFVATHRFDPERQRKELMAALQRHDEGVICQPLPGQAEIYGEIIKRGIPLVFIGDQPEDLPEVSHACWDSAAAARVAVEHLVATGRRRIGHIGFDYPMRWNAARFAAYRGVLREAGLPCHERWIAKPPVALGTDGIIEAALAQIFAPGAAHPDALFVLNDGLALPTLEALERRGIRVPEDVAVIGMGDLPFTGHRGIGLSTVHEPCEDMGRAAAEAMRELIASPMKAPIQRTVVANDLKVRRSSGAATERPIRHG